MEYTLWISIWMSCLMVSPFGVADEPGKPKTGQAISPFMFEPQFQLFQPWRIAPKVHMDSLKHTNKLGKRTHANSCFASSSFPCFLYLSMYGLKTELVPCFKHMACSWLLAHHQNWFGGSKTSVQGFITFYLQLVFYTPQLGSLVGVG